MIKLAQTFLFCFSILPFFSKSYGQEQEINLLKPDLKLLAHYTKLYTDSVRLAHGLEVQQYENTLYFAADDHALYLLSNKLLSHRQEAENEKMEPQDRVHFYGGEFSYLSENLARVPLISSTENTPIAGSRFERVLWSYERTAQFIVESWVNSPEHYKNLINEYSTHTAIAIKIDDSDGALYAVQLFSKPNGAAVAAADLFPFQALSLKPIDFSFLPAHKINKRLDRYGVYARKVKVSRGILSTNFKTARKLFKWYKRDAGLIFESENDTLYHQALSPALSGNTRANGLHYFNTTKELTIKRGQLFKQARASIDPQRDLIKLLGIKLPFIKRSAKFQYSLPWIPYSDILLTDGRYPYFLFTPIAVPSGNYALDFISFDHELPSYEALKPRINVCKATYNYKLYYQPNAIISDDFEGTYLNFKYLLEDSKNVLDTVLLNTTASIEGSSGANRKLFDQRARSIYDSLARVYKGKKPALKVVTTENWEMMAGQLMASPYASLKNEGKDSVRSFMTANRELPPFQSWLDDQRFAQLVLVVSTYDTLPYTLPILDKLYEEALTDFVNNTATKIKIDSLLKLQAAYFKMHLESAHHGNKLRRVGQAPELVPLRFKEVEYLLSKGLMDETTAFEECSEMASNLKRGELYLLKDLHMQLMVNLSLKGVASLYEPTNFVYLDKFYQIYHKPKVYERWKESANDYLYQSTINLYYKQLIDNKRKVLFAEAIPHYLGDYYLRRLAEESRHNFIVSRKHIRWLADFKRAYVDKLAPLNVEEAFRIGVFFCRYYEYDWALEMFERIPIEGPYGTRAAKMSATIYLGKVRSKPADILVSLYEAIGAEEWCEYMRNPAYFNYQKHFFYQSRKLYCEVCL